MSFKKLTSGTLLLALFIFSCKQDKENMPSDPVKAEALDKALAQYEKSKSDETFGYLSKAYGDAILYELSPVKKESLLVDAIKVCEGQPQHNMALAFATELLKQNPTHDFSKIYMIHLSDAMKMRQKNDASAIILAGYVNLYGKGGDNQKIAGSIPLWTRNIPAYLDEAAKKIFENPTEGEYNVEATRNYIDLCEAYALSFAKKPESPEYLFKAAEMARSLGDYAKTISLYDWISKYYPTHKHAPMALFLKGFTIENEFKKYDLAKESYDLFIQKYPTDPMVKDVKTLLQNLGKSNADVIKSFENNKK